MRITYIPFALVICISGCFPAIYVKHFGGRVVDTQGNPVADATVFLTVNKVCGSVGGRTDEQMSAVIRKTNKNGEFSATAAGGGLFYTVVIAGCGGFEKQLQICSLGKWNRAYYERIGRGGTIKESKQNENGDYVFDSAPSHFGTWPDGDNTGKAKLACAK